MYEKLKLITKLKSQLMTSQMFSICQLTLGWPIKTFALVDFVSRNWLIPNTKLKLRKIKRFVSHSYYELDSIDIRNRKHTWKVIFDPGSLLIMASWCPCCHLKNRRWVLASGRQALWSRIRSFVINLQWLPECSVAYRRNGSSSELCRT